MSTCYNRGCSKEGKFVEDENCDDACQHHPGAPIFHEGFKGWSCCDKKSLDFTDFLNIPGCSKGRHNPIKPPPPKKYVPEDDECDDLSKTFPKMMTQKAPDVVLKRPSNDLPKTNLRTIIANSLKTALAQHKKKMNDARPLNDATSDAIQVGASCKHNACDMKYVSEESTDCIFHPGYPVFHEGYKFWTCCKKRTSDFDEFLKQTGCKNEQHDWMKPSEVLQKKSTCRYDWHQTGKYTIITVYSKNCEPENCYVEVNATSIHAFISFNGGVDTFELELVLSGVIDPDGSSVEYMKTKAEIKLRKRDPFSWSKLEHTLQ